MENIIVQGVYSTLSLKLQNEQMYEYAPEIHSRVATSSISACISGRLIHILAAHCRILKYVLFFVGS